MSLRIVPFNDNDREPILALWAKALPLDAITVDILERRVLLDDNFDGETFLLGWDEKNGLAGFVLGIYGHKSDLGDADPGKVRAWILAFGIRPGDDVNQVGGQLLAELERRLRAKGKKEILVSTYPPAYFTPGIDRNAYRPLLDFFCSNGYKEIHQALSMDASIVHFTVSDEVVEKERAIRDQGIEIRPYERKDLLRFLTFLEQTMPTDWVRVERANLRSLAHGQFSTQQITVVAKGEEIIGYCQFEGSHFGPFGVRDAYQGKGIGTVLLARTLERMRSMGYHDAWVMWTDDIAAKVYQKFGFKETRRFSILQKVL
jgi:GNAT superfamily N-acetyltransferase